MSTISPTSQKDTILEFLRSGSGKNFVLKSMAWKGPVRFRLRAVQALFAGVFTLREFPSLIRPTASRPRDLAVRFGAYMNSEAQKGIAPFLNKDNSVDIFEHPFYVPLDNYYELVDLLEQIIVFDQYQAQRFIKKDSVVIDAGANIGTFSAFAAHLAPRGAVYAFEPTRRTFEILKKNVAGYSHVTPVNSGLGDVKEEKQILVYENTTGGNVFADSAIAPGHVEAGDAHFENAAITTIDDFVEERNIARVDFIKMDTEGYEMNILNGARKTIARDTPIVAMSAYHKPEDKKGLPAIMQSICPDYRYELHNDYEEDFIFYPRKI